MAAARRWHRLRRDDQRLPAPRRRRDVDRRSGTRRRGRRLRQRLHVQKLFVCLLFAAKFRLTAAARLFLARVGGCGGCRRCQRYWGGCWRCSCCFGIQVLLNLRPITASPICPCRRSWLNQSVVNRTAASSLGGLLPVVVAAGPPLLLYVDSGDRRPPVSVIDDPVVAGTCLWCTLGVCSIRRRLR